MVDAYATRSPTNNFDPFYVYRNKGAFSGMKPKCSTKTALQLWFNLFCDFFEWLWSGAI